MLISGTRSFRAFREGKHRGPDTGFWTPRRTGARSRLGGRRGRTRTSACRPLAFWSSTSTGPTTRGPAKLTWRVARRLPGLTDAPWRSALHLRQPAGKAWSSTASRIAPKVDTRANGGYIVLPPSVVGGKPYRWTENLETCPADLPEPPAWLAAQVDGGADLFVQGGNRPADDGKVAAQGAPWRPRARRQQPVAIRYQPANATPRWRAWAGPCAGWG